MLLARLVSVTDEENVPGDREWRRGELVPFTPCQLTLGKQRGEPTLQPKHRTQQAQGQRLIPGTTGESSDAGNGGKKVNLAEPFSRRDPGGVVEGRTSDSRIKAATAMVDSIRLFGKRMSSTDPPTFDVQFRFASLKE